MAVRRGGAHRRRGGRFVTAVTDAGVPLVGLNFFAGDMPGGDRGLVSWPARCAEFRDNIDVGSRHRRAAGLHAPSTRSTATGRTASPAAEQDELAAENLALAAAAAARIGGTVLVEPVSGAAALPAAAPRPTRSA